MKIKTAILCIMLLSHIAIFAQDDNEKSGTCGNNLTWELIGTTIHISGHGSMTNFTTRYVGPSEDELEEIGRASCRERV